MNYIPLISVYLMSVLYPVNEEIGKNISFRPPGYVFAIVWPILLLLLGHSWNKNKTEKLYYILTLLLSFWYYMYNKNKHLGLVNIILSLLITVKLYTDYNDKFLIPLILWLCFASLLNFKSLK